jgi:hypothetical protein
MFKVADLTQRENHCQGYKPLTGLFNLKIIPKIPVHPWLPIRPKKTLQVWLESENRYDEPFQGLEP